MKYIISGTDRADSNSYKMSLIIQKIYKDLGEDVEIIDLRQVKEHLHTGPHYGNATEALSVFVNKVVHSEGLIVVCPEYNGSMPGVLKYFIDHMKFPDSFEYRPVCFVGLGGMFGGLRPVEHLQQVFGFRNGYIFPQRVFLTNIKDNFKDGKVTDPLAHDLLKAQARDFVKFIHALESQGLDANSRLKNEMVDLRF